MKPLLLLFEDHRAQEWEPFALTRPVGELLFGVFLLRERAERVWGKRCLGYLGPRRLLGFSEPGAPPVTEPGAVSRDSHRILQVSRAVPVEPPSELPDEAATLLMDGEVAGWILPPGAPLPPEDLLLQPEILQGGPTLELKGRLLDRPWDLMAGSGEQLHKDIPGYTSGYAAEEIPGCEILGDGLLSLGKDVELDPGSVFDVREGPIRLDDGVVVRSHTRLRGPAYIGPGSTLLGGIFAEVSVGPVCKVRGEVETTVILGYSNKAHDGFLGHACLGRWVNLGAFTTNSDLKNNYGPVRVGTSGGPVDTGFLKVGAFLGDHVKTGIGTLLNTGTTVGAGSNLFGGAMPPTYVPPFSWGSGEKLATYRLDKFLEVARRAMARRNMDLDEGMETLLERAWGETRHLRPGDE